MISSKKGSLTIFLALIMLTFLSFCLVLIEGTRIYFLRVKAVQAIELAEFSILSEYQQELFEKYGLFFLELDYEQGEESIEILEQRAQTYLVKNASELQTSILQAGKFERATDNGGYAFFSQAVEWMKLKSGYKLFEELLGNVGDVTLENVDLGEILEENEAAAGGILNGYQKDEDGTPFHISLPDISFPSIDALTEAVFGETNDLSQKSVNLSERISKRELFTGEGNREERSFVEMQLFHGYIFQNCNYYGRKDENIWTESLKYQLEYIISGRESDQENLENIMWRIFLLRAGGNYLFYHQDAEQLAKAQAEAFSLVGFLGNTALIEFVKEIILISQAIEDGITQTKQVFLGEKVPLYQNGIFSGVELGYEEYLYLFLDTTERTEKIYRCMDIVEMEVREKSGYESFRLDHCVDCFELQWDYQFPSLFTVLPMMDGGIYENTIIRKIYYEY